MINVISAPKKEKCSFSAKTYYQAHHPIHIVIHVQFILRTDTKSVIFEVIKSFIVIDNIMRLIFLKTKPKRIFCRKSCTENEKLSSLVLLSSSTLFSEIRFHLSLIFHLINAFKYSVQVFCSQKLLHHVT